MTDTAARNGRSRLALAAPLVVALGACTVDFTFVGAGGLAPLIDGTVDAVRLTGRALAALIAHPLDSLRGMEMAIDRWDDTLDLARRELHALLALPGVDNAALLYSVALLAVCAALVVLLAGLCDNAMTRLARRPQATRRHRRAVPVGPLRRAAWVLRRARAQRLERRLGCAGGPWPHLLRRLGWVVEDGFSGLRLIVGGPRVFALYAFERLAGLLRLHAPVLLVWVLRQTVYVLLPLSLLLHPWIDYQISSRAYAASAESQLAAVSAIFSERAKLTKPPNLVNLIDALEQAHEDHRARLLLPIVDLDRRLDKALYLLDASVEDKRLGDKQMDSRLDNLMRRYGDWHFLIETDLFHPRIYGVGAMPISERNVFLSYARQSALLERGAADRRDAPGRELLEAAMQSVADADRFDRCIVSSLDSHLLMKSRAVQYACCGSRTAPLDEPIAGCRAPGVRAEVEP